jgi:hypothetical protein
MIDPLSELPDDRDAWSDDGAAPSRLASVARTLEIMPEQVLHDDLRRVVGVNRQFARLDRLAEALGPHLGVGAVEALRTLLDDDREGDEDPSALLRRAAARVAGLDDKVPVHLDFISPLIMADDDERGIAGMLAGEVMGDFGGFVHRRLRRSDFALGFECLLRWLPGGLDALGLASETISDVTAAVRGARRTDWSQADEGRTALGDLPRSSQVALLRLGMHTLRVVATEAWRAVRPERGTVASAAMAIRDVLRRSAS